MADPKQQIFLKAYEACHEPFVRYCSALAYGKMDAEDLVQDVLLSAYQHFEKIEKKDQFLHYLIRSARNRSISNYQKRKWKNSLFQVKIKGQKLRQLFDELHQTLEADQLISSISDYVLIELPKDEIRVNGVTLIGAQAKKYAELIDKFKIKRADNRQIQISEHIIRVGDYKPDSFTGSFAVYE